MISEVPSPEDRPLEDSYTEDSRLEMPFRYGPISPGNVVSAAVRIYRNQFKTYFALSFKACLWLLFPVYGWAKWGMYNGLMARMAYQTLIGQPETAKQAYKKIQPKLWSFLGIGFQCFLFGLAAYIGYSFVSGIVSIVFVMLIGGLLSAVLGNSGVMISSILSAIFSFGLFTIGFIWLTSRLFIAEVPIAIEPNLSANASINRSWQLTQRSVGRIQIVVLATYLVIVPLYFFSTLLSQILFLIPQLAFPSDGIDTTTASLFSLVVLLISATVIVGMFPFWQAAKGVLYYDLRSRREGIDLRI